MEKNISGIGLGLCICKAVVGQFNGKIDFVSEPGIGSTFMFTFDIDGISNERGQTEENKSSLISCSQQPNYRNTQKSFMFLDGIADKPNSEKERL